MVYILYILCVYIDEARKNYNIVDDPCITARCIVLYTLYYDTHRLCIYIYICNNFSIMYDIKARGVQHARVLIHCGHIQNHPPVSQRFIKLYRHRPPGPRHPRHILPDNSTYIIIIIITCSVRVRGDIYIYMCVCVRDNPARTSASAAGCCDKNASYKESV